MSLRRTPAVTDQGPTCASRLELVLQAGSRAVDSRPVAVKPNLCTATPIGRQATPRFIASQGSVVLSLLGPPKPKPIATAASIERPADGFSYMGMEDDTDATGKRKVDGSLAATRLGQTTTQRWANERFRQTMLLVLEYRREWPGESLLSADDVEGIRTATDNALTFATTSGHVGDQYDTVRSAVETHGPRHLRRSALMMLTSCASDHTVCRIRRAGRFGLYSERIH